MATIRNVEDLNLDDITEESLTEEAINMGTALNVDTRQGSIYRDAAAGHIARTAEFFDALTEIRDILSIFTCTGDVLDEYLKQAGMARDPEEATPATYKCYFVGAEPEIGATMIVDETEFTVLSKESSEENCWLIQSVDTGTDMNNFASGTAVIPDDDIDDLENCTLGDLVVAAADIEDDDSARARMLSGVGADVEAGNAAQFLKWCKEIDGVGRAEIYPLQEGPGTVTGYITSVTGGKPADSVIKAVQDTIDPGANGEGEGLAPIGCTFYAVAVEEFPVTIGGTVTLVSGSDSSVVKAKITEKIVAYLKNLALTAEDITGTKERSILINTIGSLIMTTNGVNDYTGLTLNGGTTNANYTHKTAPVLSQNNLTFA